MFTVKFKNYHGWTIKYADEVRVGDIEGEPTVICDTCRSGGGQECTLITYGRGVTSEDPDHDFAEEAYIENANGQTTHIVRASPARGINASQPHAI